MGGARAPHEARYDLFGVAEAAQKTNHAAAVSDKTQPSAKRGLDVYKKAAALPVFTSASVHSSGGEAITIRTTFTTANVDTLAKTTWSQHRTVVRDAGRLKLVATGAAVPHGKDVLNTAYSLSGRKTATFTKADDGGVRIDVIDQKTGATAGATVGKKEATSLYTDETYGAPLWSPDERLVAFVVEAPAPDDLPEKVSWHQDGGEKFIGKARPCIFLFDSVTSSAARVTQADFEKGIAWGQPAFGPSADGKICLFATGYETTGDGFRLGIVFCTNRPSAIWRLDVELEEDAFKIASVSKEVWRVKGLSSRSPVVHDQDMFLLANAEGGEHNTCSSLYTTSVGASSWTQTTETVQAVEKPSSPSAFPGIYATSLPSRSILLLGGRKVFAMSSIWRSRMAVLLIDAKSGRVSRLEIPEGTPADGISLQLLATDGRSRILLSASAVHRLPVLWLFEVNAEGDVIDGTPLTDLPRHPDWLPAVERRQIVLETPADEPAEVFMLVPVIESPKLLIYAHGGPHSTFLSTSIPEVWAYAAAGFAVALVNYTGSLGFGRAAVQKLLGRIGELDVQQHRLAAAAAAKELGIESQKPFYLGGSHSGFIGAHLSARYPDEWRAFVLRNPVTDLVSMSMETDIPDWCYAEAGLPYCYAHPPRTVNATAYERLYSMSPARHLQEKHLDRKSKHQMPPTVLILGANDKRVPLNQGKAWYFGLKQAGADVESFMVPETGHSLDSVEGGLVMVETALRLYERISNDQA